jgi:hypothetical protein
LAAALAIVTARSRSEEPVVKISQAEAQYQNMPKGLFSCAACTFYQADLLQARHRRDQPQRLVQAVRFAGLTGIMEQAPQMDGAGKEPAARA